MNRYTKIGNFHGGRRKGVGSSDIPILAGLSRHYGATTLTVWEGKTGRREPWKGNDRTAWGNKLEALVLREFVARRFDNDIADKFLSAKRAGRSIGQFKTLTEARLPDRQYCLAHADLVVEHGTSEGLPYIVEAKTSGFMAGKRREGQVFSGYDPDDLSAQGIPDAVYLQVQWQLLCYGIDTAYVAVLIDTADYREYGPIVADKRTQERCLALAERFWQLVETDTVPAPETWDDVVKLFPHQTDTTAMVAGADEDRVREMIKRDKEIAARIKQLEEERDDIKNAVGILIGGNSVLASAGGDILAKSSEQTRESVSLARLHKDAPEIERQLRDAGLVSASSFRTVRY